MNYEQTLDYLLTRLPMFSRIGSAAIRKDLVNTITLCERLDNPQQKFRSIHIAGTNGKGSTSHMLAAVLQAAGYKTGLYTSPHLKDFRERIRINGAMIREQFVTDFVESLKPVIEAIDPSFFELTVAMAFDYFAKEQVDVAVIEVGLGGRLDSTNIIQPEISVITNIGFDHMHLLGNTLEKIAGEKAGIIKPNIPVVIGETGSESREVFINAASEKQAAISFADQCWNIEATELKARHLTAKAIELSSGRNFQVSLDLPGIYQLKNLATVLQTLTVLKQRGWKLEDHAIIKGLSQVRALTGLHGRWEQVSDEPRIILDVAHNEDGILQLTKQLELEHYNRLHCVIGMVKDKDVAKVLTLLPANATYYFTKANIPRALDESELQQLGAKAGLTGEAYPFIGEALKAATDAATSNDLILICGSVFLVGEVPIKL
ncbi:MAG TPA: folylpolyglutamate synthase/dihydrofolate synthase family protein [Flavitalea sp.]|nr:folylpolyglutamate synthase/dihydrofolate synthase family protein [Flavitalea sp.]